MTTYVAEEVFARLQGNPQSDRRGEMRWQHGTGRQAPQRVNVDEVLHDSFPASDPPSWTGAISHAAPTSTAPHVNEGITRRVRAEFIEMPGLCLTIEQAQRLWGLAPREGEAVLRSLIDSRFLRRTAGGRFVMCRPGE